MSLLQGHLHTLMSESGILDTVIAERGYYSVEGKAGTATLRTLGFPRRQALLVPGLVLPVHTTDGQQPLASYRPDQPALGPDGRVRKYLLPKGAGVRIDCPPRCRPQLADPSRPLWITEGQKKGDALSSVGATTIALLGVWGIKGKNAFGGTTILADLDYIAFDQRPVHIVFDSDVMLKPAVAYALERLVEHLTRKGAIVDACYLPTGPHGKCGVDDFLVQGHTLTDLEALCEAPRQVQRLSPAVQAIPTLKLTPRGIPRPLVCNIVDILSQDARWTGVFGFDEFGQQEMLVQRPPYLPDTGPWTPRPLTDQDDSSTSVWLQREYDLCAATSTVAEGIQLLVHHAPYHPVRDYLNGLAWDGHPRLDTWLSTYCHATDTPFTRTVGAKTLISGVARILVPGCKADCMTILQGPQGTYKSTVWRTLASDGWFSDTLPDIHTKDAAQGLRGKWLIEFGELATLRRSEREVVKRFLSANQDHYRPSFGRRALTFPRHNIFVGTTNQDAIFTDETGDRRYWPVTVQSQCDIVALECDRDQLWAEAVHRYRHGAMWYLTTEEECLANTEREARFEADVWEESIAMFVTGKDYVTTQQILVDCLGMYELAHQNVVHSRRVGAVLRRLQWEGNKPVWITRPDGTKHQIKAWKPRTPPTTTPPPQGPTSAKPTMLPMLPIEENIGNGISIYKNKGVTDITDVTDTYRRQEVESNEFLDKPVLPQNHAIFSTASIANIGNTGNNSNTTDIQGVPALPDFPVTGNNGVAPVTSVQVGATFDLPPYTYITTAEQLTQALPELLVQRRLALDTETTGLSWVTDRIRLVQIATVAKVVLVDAFQCPLEPLLPLFQNPTIEFLGHNLKFDLHMLASGGLPQPERVFDTMLASQILGASTTKPKKHKTAGKEETSGWYSLKGVVERTLQQTLDKTLQTSDWSGPLAEEQLQYAARDVTILFPLAQALEHELTRADLTKITKIEMACVPAMVAMERAGMPFDVAPWLDRARHEQETLAALHTTLDTLVRESGYTKPVPHTKIGKVPKGFDPAINWNSANQVLALLQSRGHAIHSYSREALADLRTDDPMVITLLRRKDVEASKTWGETWVQKFVRDGRVYADFLQIGSTAGRMSCIEPNLQNIPHAPEYRRCFRAPDGSALLKADYGQIELRIAAVLANEPHMLAAFQRGDDLHRTTAANVYHIDPDAVTPAQRHVAKTVNFGLIYGLGAESLRTKVWTEAHIDISIDEADAFRSTFFRLYPAFKRWHAQMRHEIDTHGSLTTRTLTNRRRLDIRRFTEAANTPTQGSAADGFKLALARLWRDRATCPDARVIALVHDEMVMEVPVAQAEQAATWVKWHMEEAMTWVVQGKVPIIADVAIGQDWAGTPLTVPTT